MACSGTHCSLHGTGTTTCSGHRASCSTNREIAPSGNFGSVGGSILASDVEMLRNNIRNEISRYKLHSQFASINLLQSVGITPNMNIDNAGINDFETMIQSSNNITEPVGTDYAVYTNPPDGTTPPNSYADATTVFASQWNTIKSKYDMLRQDCICNADCTCNLVCNCHNNCGCNYSDMNLKREIVYW